VPEYLKNLFIIPGVEAVVLERHSIKIKKGEMFSWEEMFPMIIFAIKDELDPEGEAVEQGPPHRPQLDSTGYKRDIPNLALQSTNTDDDLSH
jgi:hypothetical protein